MDEEWQSGSEMSKWSTTRKLANKFSTRKRRKRARMTAQFSPSQVIPLGKDDNTIHKSLQSLILGSRQSWTYAIFWQAPLDPLNYPALVLGWGDGYFQGEEANKQRTSTLPEEQAHRKKVLRELNSLTGEPDQEPDDVTDSEWFFLVSMTQSFVNGSGLPGRALYTSTAVWVSGADRLASFDCEHSKMAGSFGIQTAVYIPLVDGVGELASSSLIFPYSEFDLLDSIFSEAKSNEENINPRKRKVPFLSAYNLAPHSIPC